ncbi:hypothetical protein IWQ61_005495 [Dispira simplex]|nr:hypothetical protein IWQ61_005495 [Dispira simplex]
MEEAIKNYEYPIPMLDEENYDQWQMAVYGLLFIRDLWDVVNPDLHKQSDDDGSLGDEREKKKREMAAKLIVSGYIPSGIIKSLRLTPLSAREM